jgi:hypothetical protein
MTHLANNMLSSLGEFKFHETSQGQQSYLNVLMVAPLTTINVVMLGSLTDVNNVIHVSVAFEF